MKVTVDQLMKERPLITELRLKSFECEHYLVELELPAGRALLCNPEGRPRVFRSQLAAKVPFKNMGIKRAVLEHQSHYDEMIGLASSSVEPLLVDISLPDNDLS